MLHPLPLPDSATPRHQRLLIVVTFETRMPDRASPRHDLLLIAVTSRAAAPSARILDCSSAFRERFGRPASRALIALGSTVAQN